MEVFLMDGPPPLANVMLDLETWGTAPGSALRSIGACEFDPHTDQIGEKFYANIADESCVEVGLIKDASTVAWWGRQTKQAQDSLLVDQKHLREVADNFHQWFRKVRGVFVWSQGANFDQPLWEAAVRPLGMRTPWKFTDSRCTRTAYDMGGFNPYVMKRAGTHHNALDDAIHQAKCVQGAYRKRNGG
jgi:hypothetical protein